MVGLIPKIHIFHITNAAATSLKRNEVFLKLAGQEDFEVIDDSSRNAVEIQKVLDSYKPSIVIIDETILSAGINTLDDYHSDYNDPFRVVLIAPEQDEVDTHLKYLKLGADEVITRDDDSLQELFFKCFSFIRRKSILELNQLSKLPSINKTTRVIDHCRKYVSDWVLMHVDTKNLKSYNTMYGIETGDKLISRAADVLKSVLANPAVSKSFLGHMGGDNFIIVCSSSAQDFILESLKSNFEQVQKDMYKPQDYENGYVICPAPNKVRRREGLVSLDIGYCNNIDRNYLSSTDIVEQAIQNKKTTSSKNKRVLVLEDDEDFAHLIAETLILEGFDAEVSKGLSKVVAEVEEFQPKVLVLEASTIGVDYFDALSQKLDKFKEEFGLKIIVATNIPGYTAFLEAGADVYLPKPYDLEVLFKEVRRLRFKLD